ncbi:MAG TPA: hypothetical protein VKR31_13305 [Rhizomicrobium sp.]|nr:hypothetical protein [Rhizomicrobium sp.]
MILVGRPCVVPAVLTRGILLRQELEQLWDAHALEYGTGVRKFQFSKAVYGHRNVKAALAKAQFEKCCFCEGEFRAHVAGDVEHYRPKGAVTTSAGKIYPGYYWLAYAFENLYFACPDCNAYRKGSQFPLVVEGHRARNHHDSLTRERPLLLSPGGPRDPRQHIRFYGDMPIGLTDAGRETISVLRLDRESLNKRRRKLIRRLEGDQNIIKTLGTDTHPARRRLVTDARNSLKMAIRPEAEFSAAAQDFIAGWRP